MGVAEREGIYFHSDWPMPRKDKAKVIKALKEYWGDELVNYPDYESEKK